MAYKPERGWGFSQPKTEAGQPELQHELELMRSRMEQLGSYFVQLENRLALQGNLAEPTKHGKPELKQPISVGPETT
jgi:hypothetical protein